MNVLTGLVTCAWHQYWGGDDVEFSPRTKNNRAGTQIAGPERFDLRRGVAFRSTWRDSKGLSVDIDAVVVGNRSWRECLRLSDRQIRHDRCNADDGTDKAYGLSLETAQPLLILRRPRIVEELHEHGVIAGAAATGEPRIILRLLPIVDELLVIADAAATGEGRIVLPAGEGRIILSRIVGELLVIADAA